MSNDQLAVEVSEADGFRKVSIVFTPTDVEVVEDEVNPYR